MKTILSHYPLFAEIFYFPSKDYNTKVKEVQLVLDKKYPLAAEFLAPFTTFATSAHPEEVQELYTRSFDVQAITTLDIGYVLFGDDYKRGALLVNLNREIAEAGLDCRQELPDHLPNVLNLLASLEDEDLKNEMVSRLIVPGLKKIIGEFNPNRVDSKNKVYEKHHNTVLETNPDYYLVYAEPLKALLSVLESDFDVQAYLPPAKSADFLGEVGKELEIEKES